MNPDRMLKKFLRLFFVIAAWVVFLGVLLPLAYRWYSSQIPPDPRGPSVAQKLFMERWLPYFWLTVLGAVVAIVIASVVMIVVRRIRLEWRTRQRFWE